MTQAAKTKDSESLGSSVGLSEWPVTNTESSEELSAGAEPAVSLAWAEALLSQSPSSCSLALVNITCLCIGLAVQIKKDLCLF